MLKTILTILFPKFCAGCGSFGKKICDKCAEKISILEYQECLMCSHPNIDGFTHKICKISYAPEQTISMFKYSGIIRSLIRKGKYKNSFKSYIPIIELFNSRSNFLQSLEQCILIPVPISKKRLQQRGYNQCEKICEYLEQYISQSKTIKILKRTKETQSQYSLKREERLVNMKNAFAIDKNLIKLIQNRKVVIVDDISTTGSTIKEACKEIYKANPKEIICLTLSKDTVY